MAFWNCSQCRGGKEYLERDGRAYSMRCLVCRGSNEGWGPGFLVFFFVTVAIALYAWVCNGCHL
jgi:hypothetical protein